jgi:hypothetical protein
VAFLPLFLSTIGDPDGTRTVTSIVVLLAALGVALLLLAVWIYRTTRPDPELLAPLEVMGERTWRRADPVWQRRRLDELRPRGARPLAPSVAPPELDEAFDAGPTATGFDDLSRSGEIAVTLADASTGDADRDPPRDSTPAGAVSPTLDELSDDDFDANALAEARADLERELADAGERAAAEQLDLFGRDPNA